MGIAIEWMDAEHRLLLYRFERVCTQTDFYTAIERGSTLIRGELHQVDAIFDLRDNKEFPKNMWSAVRWAFQVQPDNFNRIAIVDERGFVINIIGAFQQIYPRMGRRIVCSFNMDAALQTLRLPQKHEE